MHKVMNFYFNFVIAANIHKGCNCSFGEENGWRCREEEADYVWVLDPIDGTKSFITGKYIVFVNHRYVALALKGFILVNLLF